MKTQEQLFQQLKEAIEHVEGTRTKFGGKLIYVVVGGFRYESKDILVTFTSKSKAEFYIEMNHGIDEETGRTKSGYDYVQIEEAELVD